jgi:lactate permease
MLRQTPEGAPVWIQDVNPTGEIVLSAGLAAIPILFLFWALAIRRLSGHVAGLLTTLLAIAVAVTGFHMPVGLAIFATIQGALYGLFPIGWIVVAAVFLYNLVVTSGQFDVIKDSIASVTEDRRLQALLIAFSFGAFLEGAAGFGTPVAISAGMLVGLGFNPLYAAGLCLIANTAPVAFGAIGTPIVVAGQVTGIDEHVISQMVGRQLPFLSVLIPVWLVFTMSGFKGVRQVWPAALVSGGTFAVSQWWTSNYLGPLLPDIVSALLSLVALVAFLRVWKPRAIFRFEGEAAVSRSRVLTPTVLLKAWSPFIVLTLLVGDWGIKPVRAVLERVSIEFPFPVVHNAVVRPGSTDPVAAIFRFNWLSATGTAILIAALITMALTRIRPADGAHVFGTTLRSLRFPLVTIAAVLGFAYVGNASGMTTTLGLALASTGTLFPFFSPLLGWLGVFMTGSDTSANAVFGRLQTVSAERLGVDPVLAIAANSSGGVTGKMISPQSIAVACAATGLVGREASLFRFTVWHSMALVALVGIMVALQATQLTWMIPAARPSPSAAAGAAGSLGPTIAWLILAATALAIGIVGWFIRGVPAARAETSDHAKRP